MDLGRCPGCGVPWVRGEERCAECHFVAIGAGLKDLLEAEKKKKKRRRRPKRYREPGSATGFLATVLGFAMLAWGLEARPWEHHWEVVRVWFGATPTRSVVGNWEVQSLVSLDNVRRPSMTPADLVTGKVTFDQNGKAIIVLQYPPYSHVTYTAKYEEEGNDLQLTGVKTDPLVDAPNKIQMTLSWQGDQSLVAAVSPKPGAAPTAEMYLRYVGDAEPHHIQSISQLSGAED